MGAQHLEGLAMSAIVTAEIAKHFCGVYYSRLTSRERAIVDFLMGLDVLKLHNGVIY